MSSLGKRRLVATIVTLVAVAVTWYGVWLAEIQLGDPATVSGATLLAATVGLFGLSARKKSKRQFGGAVAVWMQMHVYLGAFACAVFVLHIGWPVNGVFEQVLAFVFVFVSATGIALGYLSRSTPKRLAALTKDQVFEEIPALQLAIAGVAHTTALESTGHGEGATLAEFYQSRLLPYFRSRRSWAYCLVPNGMLRRQLLRELNDLSRYLGVAGQVSLGQLARSVRQKDDLDYQYALQARLQYFFAAHVALTWSLAILVAVHVVLVFRFQGTVL